MAKMVFMGTPQFAATILEDLVTTDYELVNQTRQ